MKKTMRNRLLAGVLALVMALGLLPLSALAAGAIRDDAVPGLALGEEAVAVAPAEVPSAGGAVAALSEGEVSAYLDVRGAKWGVGGNVVKTDAPPRIKLYEVSEAVYAMTNTQLGMAKGPAVDHVEDGKLYMIVCVDNDDTGFPALMHYDSETDATLIKDGVECRTSNNANKWNDTSGIQVCKVAACRYNHIFKFHSTNDGRWTIESAATEGGTGKYLSVGSSPYGTYNDLPFVDADQATPFTITKLAEADSDYGAMVFNVSAIVPEPEEEIPEAPTTKPTITSGGKTVTQIEVLCAKHLEPENYAKPADDNTKNKDWWSVQQNLANEVTVGEIVRNRSGYMEDTYFWMCTITPKETLEYYLNELNTKGSQGSWTIPSTHYLTSEEKPELRYYWNSETSDWVLPTEDDVQRDVRVINSSQVSLQIFADCTEVVVEDPDFQFPTAGADQEIVYQQVKTQAELPTDGRLVALVQPDTSNNKPRVLYHADGTGRTDQLEVTITGETVALNHTNTAFTKERQLWAVVPAAGGYKLKSWDDSLYLTATAHATTTKQLAVDETGAVFTVEAQSDGTFYVKSGDQYLRFYTHNGGDGWGLSDTATPLKLFNPVAKDVEAAEPPEPNEDQCWAYVSFGGKWGLSATPYTLKIYKAANDSDTTGTEVTSLEALESGASYFLKSSSHFMHRANGQSTNQCMTAGCGTMHMFKLALDRATGCWTVQSRQNDGYYLSIANVTLETHNQLPFASTAQNFVIKKVDGGFTLAAIVEKPAARTEEATLTRTGTGATTPIPSAATGSNKFRIPALTTLSNGWVVAAADVRWNHGADNPGNLDTIVSVSKDNGRTWDWEIVNYFGDYAPTSHNALSASFIDPALVQDPETGKLWMFIDVTAANGKYGKGSTGFTDDGCLLVANLPAYVGQRAPETPASYTYCVSATPASVTYQGKALRAIVSVADRSQTTGYYVDAFMDLYQDGDNGVERVMCDQVGSDKLVQCNLFYKQSEWKVYPCGYLMLRSATVTDTGLVWDDPIFPGNLRGEHPGSSAGFFGACPGRGTVTETGRILFVVYDAVNDNHDAEFASVIYSDDNGATWHRGERATSQADTGKASESQVVCLPDGSLRMYSRNSIGYIGYTDSADDGLTWGTYQRDTALPYVGNCMISFINLEGYLTDAEGNTYENLILGSYPKGSGRYNGVVRIGYVNTQAAGQPVVWLNDDTVRYSGYYAYSCLTQLQVDGKPSDQFADFYEDTSGHIAYTTVSVTDLLGQGWTLTVPDPVVPDPGPDVPDPGPDDPDPVIYTVTIDGVEFLVKEGETLGDRMPADPEDPGYRFNGWMAEETNSVFTADTEVTRDLTVVSTWSMEICMVTVGEEVFLVPYGTTLGDQMPADPTFSGYTFAGWLTADGLVFTADTVVTGDITVTASWTVTPPSSGGGSASTPSEEELDEPETPLAGGVVPSFVDVAEKDWFFADVCAVFAAGIMKGSDEAHFKPDALLNRGMMAQVLYNLEKDPVAAAANPFADVTDGNYYLEAVTWGAEQGVLKGYDNGLYGGEDQVTREQMVLMLYRYSEKKGLDMTAEANALAEFADGAAISQWAAEAVRWAVSKGLIQGRNGGALEPGAEMTRAEVAAILARYVKLLNK